MLARARPRHRLGPALAVVRNLGREGAELGPKMAEFAANFTGLVRDAVSKPNFASKYAFESSRRDLHNSLLRTATALKSHAFLKICENYSLLFIIIHY